MDLRNIMLRKKEMLRRIREIDAQLIADKAISTKTLLMLGNLLTYCGHKNSGNGLIVAALKDEMRKEQEASKGKKK